MATRFRRPKDKEEIFKSLVQNEDAPFLTFKDVFLMAACLGFKNSNRIELPPGGEQIPWSVFSESTDQAIVNAIALCEKGEFNILLDKEEQTDEKFRIIEEYANAGLNVLKTELLDAPGDPLDNLINLIFQQEDTGIEKINRSLLQDIELSF
jgi:dnd system-associated protein 4